MKMQKSLERIRSGRLGMFGTKTCCYCENAKKSWKRVRLGRPGRFGTKNLSYHEDAQIQIKVEGGVGRRRLGRS